MTKKHEQKARKGNGKRNQNTNDSSEELEQPMNDHAVLPSKAEGERELIEDKLNDHSTTAADQNKAEAPLQEPKLTPSQAEGERFEDDDETNR
jgi:hypothetical protein